MAVLYLAASALLSFILLRICIKLVRRRINRLPHPPGPAGYPIVGNLTLPSPTAWKTYREWGSTYGSDVIRLNVLGTNIIILNSFDAAVEILEKRSLIYSDRPRNGMTMLCDLCGFGWTFALQPYGQEWRDGRKAFQREFSASAVTRFRPIELKEARKFLHRLLHSPQDFISHTRQMTGAVILSIAYGIEIRSKDDEYLTIAEHVMEAANSTMVPGAYLVDLVPLLRYIPEWFPGGGFQTQARIWRRSVMDMLNKPWELVKQTMGDDDSPDSAAKALIENMVGTAKDPKYMEKVVRAAVASMYVGGSDTTLSVLSTFFLAMVLYPDVQLRARDLIDNVCKGRLPDFSDFDSLPYIHAIVKECLRWHPVLSLVPPHRSTQDDVFGKYYIPEGSIVFVNNSAILQNTVTYPEPDRFKPERFLKASGTSDSEYILDPSVLDPVDVAFGFGRRICPGKHMAYDSTWIAVASILAAYEITKATDVNGEKVTPPEDYTDGFVTLPKPFPCSITPRSSDHADLVLDAAEE